MNNSPWITNEANTATLETMDGALGLFESAPEATATTSGEPIPAGRYLARLESGGMEQSGKGNWCWTARWLLSGGAHDGRRLVSRHWLTPKAVARTKAELGALGLTAEHLRGAALPCIMAELSVKLRADECGDLYSEVKKVVPAKSAAMPEKTSYNAPQGTNGGAPIPTQGAPMETPQDADCDYLDSEFGGGLLQ